MDSSCTQPLRSSAPTSSCTTDCYHHDRVRLAFDPSCAAGPYGWSWAAILVFATIVVGGGLDARRRLPDLEPWHRIVPRDVRASDLTPRSSLADYLAIEDAAFRTVHDRIELQLDAAAKVPANRYNPDGRAYPGRFGTDWNRTQELAPDGEAIGGALLVHGLTDGPYSMRAIGEDA